jgi:hypothetical protein
MGGKGGKGPFVYRLDAQDRIVHVNRAWLSFAAENESDALTPEAVLDRPLWDFIADKETRQVYRMILTRVRSSGKEVYIPFRCDSPGIRRFMEMEIARLPEGAVEFRCRLIRAEKRLPIALLDPAADRSDELLQICGWCKRINLDGGWVEAEEAVKRLDLFGAERLPGLTHGICPDCHATAMREIERTRGEGDSPAEA